MLDINILNSTILNHSWYDTSQGLEETLKVLPLSLTSCFMQQD